MTATLLDDDRLIAALVASETRMRTEYAHNLELMAEAQRRGLAGHKGYKDLPEVCTHAGRAAVREHQPLRQCDGPEFPRAAEAAAEGILSAEHLEVITRATWR